jgi:hypothetical protein
MEAIRGEMERGKGKHIRNWQQIRLAFMRSDGAVPLAAPRDTLQHTLRNCIAMF